MEALYNFRKKLVFFVLNRKKSNILLHIRMRMHLILFVCVCGHTDFSYWFYYLQNAKECLLKRQRACACVCWMSKFVYCIYKVSERSNKVGKRGKRKTFVCFWSKDLCFIYIVDSWEYEGSSNLIQNNNVLSPLRNHKMEKSMINLRTLKNQKIEENNPKTCKVVKSKGAPKQSSL